MLADVVDSVSTCANIRLLVGFRYRRTTGQNKGRSPLAVESKAIALHVHLKKGYVSNVHPFIPVSPQDQESTDASRD